MLVEAMAANVWGQLVFGLVLLAGGVVAAILIGVIIDACSGLGGS